MRRKLEKRCGNCGRTNHATEQCRVKRVNTVVTTTTNTHSNAHGNGSKKFCTYCKKPGHLVDKCFKYVYDQVQKAKGLLRSPRRTLMLNHLVANVGSQIIRRNVVLKSSRMLKPAVSRPKVLSYYPGSTNKKKDQYSGPADLFSAQCPLFLCHSLRASASVTRRLQHLNNIYYSFITYIVEMLQASCHRSRGTETVAQKQRTLSTEKIRTGRSRANEID
ncbi:unnamed protein product [Trichogramma brassicae]|uniref:CCHC-type domain-containing protein n=1 Tax=Trichogramma brassicae TaxID=86971 RepID=A0A6H5J921_9HYME|nr:unnamed protein product [Trichogramma brassicae]